jgi:CHASE3 domain sensor protein
MRSRDVNPEKCPHLYAALRRAEVRYIDEGWARVIELRRSGQDGTADRLVRKLLGVQGPPMSEETKEKLRRWNEEHKEEIQERKKSERQIRERTIALLTTGRRVRR